MKRVTPLYSVAIVVLLLPGLALASPIAGSCGRCGDGDDCPMKQSVQPASETRSCCDTESQTPREASLASSNCECGRDAPTALTAESLTTVETASATTSTREEIGSIIPFGAASSYSARLAAPPPSPPTYLIDCAFLT